jgi:DNA-binding beta-propeller fold protein YncE
MKNILKAFVCTIALLLTSAEASFAASSTESSHRIVKKIVVGGQGGWDYLTVDPEARRLYVSHTTQVDVIDLDTAKLIGTIPETPGVHGIALVPGSDRGYISAGKASSVIIFDKKTLKRIEEVKVGNKPDAIIFDPASSKVFVFNGDDSTATVINTSDNKIAGTLKIAPSPEFAVADGKGHVFNNSEQESLLLRLDSKGLTVDERWPLSPCQAPSSLDMDRKNHRLFVGCRNKLMAVVDSNSGKVLTTLPIGEHVDATAFDEQTGLIYCSNGDGTITVVHQDSPTSYRVTETIKTLPRSKTCALDKKTHQLYVPAIEGGQFEILVIGR